MSIELITSFILTKREDILKSNDGIAILKEKSPIDVLTGGVRDKATSTAVDQLKGSPLSQLGEDYLAEQVSKNGGQILNNVTNQLEEDLDRITGIPVRQTLENSQQLVFNTMSAAITAENDLIMYFLQELAKNCINRLENKIRIARLLVEKLRLLYNALIILVHGQPYFSAYLDKLRRALIKLDQAEKLISLVKGTLEAKDFYLGVQFKDAQDLMDDAKVLITPEENDPDVKFTDGGLLENVGIPSEPQQATIILSIPQLVQDVLMAANGYFTATLETNIYLLGYIQGLDKLKASSSKKLTEYTLSMLSSLKDRLNKLNNKMGLQINGPKVDPETGAISGARDAPVPGFTPDPIKTSANALGWVIELQTIIEYAKFVPGKTFEDIQLSNDAVKKYLESVAKLQEKDDRIKGDAILRATDGRESLGDLESQLSTFCAASLRAIVDAEIADNILSLGRTIITRVNLSITQDTEIIEILGGFSKADLAFRGIF